MKNGDEDKEQGDDACTEATRIEEGEPAGKDKRHGMGSSQRLCHEPHTNTLERFITHNCWGSIVVPFE
jgi:hypothetical protein